MIYIYTDGAYSPSNDRGGWAFIVTDQKDVLFKVGDAVSHTTNNRMEIEAVIRALIYVLNHIEEKEVTIYSDSMYVIGTLTQHWKIKKNVDLWKQMYIISQKLKEKDIKVHFIHVKGHNGEQYNELCDELAVFYSKTQDYECN